MCVSTYRNWVMSQYAGFHTGTGRRRIGSTCPNRIARTTYIGATNSKASQRIPGMASDGQSSRRRPVTGLATGVELLPDLVVLVVGVERQLEQPSADLEVAGEHCRGRQVRGHEAVLHHLGG